MEVFAFYHHIGFGCFVADFLDDPRSVNKDIFGQKVDF